MNAALARALYRAGQYARGERVFEVLSELEASQRWTLDRLREVQWMRQQRLIRHAWDTVPHYREAFRHAGWTDGVLRDREQWSALPLLSKGDVHHGAERLMSSRPEAGTLATTSGSSGTPVAVMRGHRSWSHAHANVFRGWHWHGLDVGDPYAYFWGLALDASSRRQAALRDWFFNRRRLSAFEADPRRMHAFFERLCSAPARFGFGYPSAVMQFAEYVRTAGLDGSRLGWRAVITTAEMLKPHQRDVLADTFGARVVDSYGCAEVGVAGFECESGGMHVPVESVVVDLEPVGDGLSEVLLTDLHNFTQPVIRYRIGDLVASPSSEACPCGRALPLLGALHGRAGDVIQLPDGRRVNPLLPYYLFRPHAKAGHVRAYQFVERGDGRIEVRVVPGEGWEDALRASITREVSEGLGLPVDVVSDRPLIRSGRGKLRDYVRLEGPGSVTSAGEDA